jgi:hypothetical protein
MGRPKGARNTKAETQLKKAAAEGSISKAAAVRQALAEGSERLDDIAAFIRTKHGIEIPRPQLSAYKAQARAREQKIHTGLKPSKAPTPIPKAAKHGGGTETDLIEAMETLKPYVNEHGAERLKRIIDLLG